MDSTTLRGMFVGDRMAIILWSLHRMHAHHTNICSVLVAHKLTASDSLCMTCMSVSSMRISASCYRVGGQSLRLGRYCSKTLLVVSVP